MHRRTLMWPGWWCMLALATGASLGACSGSPSPSTANQERTPTIFAAASTTDAINQVLEAYQRQTGEDVLANFAASSILARQIADGASADLFLSANREWMDYLEERSLLRPDTRSDLLSNRLVLVVPKGAPSRTLNLTNLPASLAVGDPAHVPAGRYAMEALHSLGLDELMQPRLVPTLDVRAALRLVEMGEVEAGIVYASDAGTSDAVDIAEEIDESLHSPVRYQVALTHDAARSAEALLEFLRSDEAAVIFRESGLSVIRE